MTDDIVQGALFTMMVMRVGGASGAALERTLRNQITRSPQFFANAPIVLDLKDSGGFKETRDFVEMKRGLGSLALIPVGVQNANPQQQVAANAAGFGTPTPPAAKRRTCGAPPPPPRRAPNRAAAPQPPPPAPPQA